MNICILTSRFYPQLVGSGTSAYLLAKSLASRGHQVTVLTDSNLQPALTYTPLPFRVSFVKDLESFSVPGSGFRKPTEDIHAHLKTLKPDILHVCNYMPMLLITMIRELISCPVVLSIHNTPVMEERSIGYYKDSALDLVLAGFIVKSEAYDCFLAGSQHYFEAARSLGATSDKLHLSHYGIDTKQMISDLATESDHDIKDYFSSETSLDQPYILIPSRITEQKGILEAVKALRIINQTTPIQLLLTGMAQPFDNNYAKKIWQLARDLGVEERIISPKRVIARHHLPKIYQKAKIVMVPSHYEGLGLAALEALALRRPLIVSDAPGLNEIVNDGENGITVSINNPSALALAVNKLLDDKFLANKLTKNNQKIIEKFDINRHASDVEDIYGRLLACQQMA